DVRALRHHLRVAAAELADRACVAARQLARHLRRRPLAGAPASIGSRVMSDAERIRLAELVAPLSLGVDVGFGQPMEHVLRQCMIALELADRVGLDDDQRAVVYYTALLVNVGCHSDAHEQAKWFGDDIAMKSTKYDYGTHSVRGA